MSDVLSIAILLLALAGDRWLGEPPNRFHPVAWMGQCIASVRRRVPRVGETQRFICGAALVGGGAILLAILGWWIERVCLQLPLVLAVAAQAAVLKTTFAVGSLARAAASVRDALLQGDVLQARRQVAFHLVSRDVSQLNPTQLSAATIESVAENTSDSVIAPLFYFAVAGLPGALVYRFVNTCDAMLGYRSKELQWFGKPAARADDLLNLVPSRLTAVLMLSVGCLRSRRAASAIGVWFRDHRLTASPNAGHPMSAAAGVLGVALEKHGHYLLGAGQPTPTPETIDRSIRLMWQTIAGGVAVVIAVLLIRG